jgi:Cu/Ag efflux pump CusA
MRVPRLPPRSSCPPVYRCRLPAWRQARLRRPAFGGARAAALILAGTPFALVGGVIAIALTGGVLSLGALVGFVTLFGIAARNAILLVAHVDHLVDEEGLPFDRATVMRAAEERVTPILMTALVTALGPWPRSSSADS